MLAAMTGALSKRRIYQGLVVALALPVSLAFTSVAQAAGHPAKSGKTGTVTVSTVTFTSGTVTALPQNQPNLCGATIELSYSGPNNAAQLTVTDGNDNTISQTTSTAFNLTPQLAPSVASDCETLGGADQVLKIVNDTAQTLTVNLGNRTIAAGSDSPDYGIKVFGYGPTLVENGTVTGFATDVFNCGTMGVTYQGMHLLNPGEAAFSDRNSLFTTLKNSVITGNAPSQSLSTTNIHPTVKAPKTPTSSTITVPVISEADGVLTEGTGGDVFQKDTVSGFYYAFNSMADVNSQYLSNSVSNSVVGFMNSYGMVENEWTNSPYSSSTSYADNNVTVPGVYNTTAGLLGGIIGSNGAAGFVDPCGALQGGQWIDNTVSSDSFGGTGFYLMNDAAYLRGNRANYLAFGYSTGTYNIEDLEYSFADVPYQINTLSGLLASVEEDLVGPSYISGNQASGDAVGFGDFGSFYSTITNNVATKNLIGMFLVGPLGDQVTGNTLSGNVIQFSRNASFGVGMLSLGSPVLVGELGYFLNGINQEVSGLWAEYGFSLKPASVSNNISQGGAAGLASDLPASGGDNMARNNSLFDCFQVSCTGNGSTRSPNGNPIGMLQKNLGTNPQLPPAGTGANPWTVATPVLPTT